MHTVKQEGLIGLYSGAGSRMIFSGVFSAIGFATFEWAKGQLGVATSDDSKSKKTLAFWKTNGSTDKASAKLEQEDAKQFARKSIAAS